MKNWFNIWHAGQGKEVKISRLEERVKTVSVETIYTKIFYKIFKKDH